MKSLRGTVSANSLVFTVTFLKAGFHLLYFVGDHCKNSGAGKGGKGGGCPPNVEKDGLRNSSKFDEKLGGGCVSISDVKKSLILNIFNVTVLFCTVFLLRGCYSELRNQRSTAFYCKNERNKPFSKSQIGYSAKYLFILTSAYEGGVGHVHSQSRGRGQQKIFWGSAPDPNIFCPPPNKISWRRHCARNVCHRPSQTICDYRHQFHRIVLCGKIITILAVNANIEEEELVLQGHLLMIIGLLRKKRSLLERKEHRKKRFWVRKILQEQKRLGQYHTLVQELRIR